MAILGYLCSISGGVKSLIPPNHQAPADLLTWKTHRGKGHVVDMHPPRYPALWCPHPGGFVGEFWRKVPTGKVRSTMHRIYGNMKILIDTVIWKYMNIRSGLLIVYIYIVLILHQCKNKSCKNISQEKSRIGWPGPQSIPFHTASATYQNHLPPQGGRAGHGARLPRHHARVSVSFQLFSYKFNPQDSN